MIGPEFGPTARFEALTDDAAQRWRRRVLAKIDASEGLRARVNVDPFLREAYLVVTARNDEEGYNVAKRLRGRWFPLHALNEDNQKRVAWLKDLQETTVTDARDRKLSGDRVKDILEQQAFWLAVLRCPLTLTDDAAWKEARKSWIAECQEEVLTLADPAPIPTRKPRRPPIEFKPISRERFLTEARLLAMESLHTALLCELVSGQVTDAQKTVLRLFYVIGLMEDQIADQMGMDPESVGQLRRRALGALRKVAVG